jgi:hypothetical protein
MLSNIHGKPPENNHPQRDIENVTKNCPYLRNNRPSLLPSANVRFPPLNFFLPARKLKGKTRAGSKETKAYGAPESPLVKLTECAAPPQKYKDALKAQRALYNPVELQRNVSKAVPRLRQRLAQSNRITARKQE